MNFEEYKDWVLSRVNLERAIVKKPIALGAMGLAGEVGEVVDEIKKALFHKGEFSYERLHKLKLEMGDVLWYYALICKELNFGLDDIITTNVNKLNQRDGNDGQKFHEVRT